MDDTQWKKARKANTRALRRLIESKAIIVNIDTGTVTWPSGKPVYARKNETGYIRFKITRKGCRWFFIHKAVYIAAKLPYRHDRAIDHRDDDQDHNYISNLQLLTYAENNAKAHRKMEMEMEMEMEAAF